MAPISQMKQSLMRSTNRPFSDSIHDHPTIAYESISQSSQRQNCTLHALHDLSSHIRLAPTDNPITIHRFDLCLRTSTYTFPIHILILHSVGATSLDFQTPFNTVPITQHFPHQPNSQAFRSSTTSMSTITSSPHDGHCSIFNY